MVSGIRPVPDPNLSLHTHAHRWAGKGVMFKTVTQICRTNAHSLPWEARSPGSHLEHLFTLSHLEEVDNRLVAVGPDDSVFILGVVKKSLQDGFDGLGVQGRQRVLVCPPDHLLSHQPDVTGWVLQTL